MLMRQHYMNHRNIQYRMYIHCRMNNLPLRDMPVLCMRANTIYNNLISLYHRHHRMDDCWGMMNNWSHCRNIQNYMYNCMTMNMCMYFDSNWQLNYMNTTHNWLNTIHNCWGVHIPRGLGPGLGLD